RPPPTLAPPPPAPPRPAPRRPPRAARPAPPVPRSARRSWTCGARLAEHRGFCRGHNSKIDAERGAELSRDLGDPGLADDGDPDLAGVGQLLFDLLGHIPGEYRGADVVDVVRLDHDPDLPAG